VYDPFFINIFAVTLSKYSNGTLEDKA